MIVSDSRVNAISVESVYQAVLLNHTILVKGFDHEEGDNGTENSKTAANPERSGVTSGGASSTEGIDHWRESYKDSVSVQ